MNNFTDPYTVISPKASVSDLAVLVNTGENGWSLASLKWDGNPVLGVRWNGHPGNPIGNPQSRGIPTWFVLPDELTDLVLSRLRAEAEKPFTLDQFPEAIKRVRLRPLPERYMAGRDQGPLDHVWNVERLDHEKGCVALSNPATGHILHLYEAHIDSVVPDPERDSDGLGRGFLKLTVQIVFRDRNIGLELLPRAILRHKLA